MVAQKWFALCYRTAVCLVCLSVTLLYCGHSWMDQDETWHTGRPRPWPRCVRWGPSSPSPKGANPPILGPYLLWPNGCMDQDATWYGGKPRPRRPCIRWGPRSPSQEGGGAPKFSAHVYCGQTAGWIKMALDMEVSLSPGDFVLDTGPSPSPKKAGEPPIFGPCLLRPNGCMDQDATSYGGRPRLTRHCVRWGPSSHSP